MSKKKVSKTSKVAKTSLTPGLTVRYSSTVSEEYPTIYAYALKVEITEAVGYPDHLFVFHRSKENNEGDWVDEFVQIASPLDVEEVPENAPDPENNMPYYRAKEVTLWFRTVDDLKLAKNKIRDDLKLLTQTYDVISGGDTKQEEERYEQR